MRPRHPLALAPGDRKEIQVAGKKILLFESDSTFAAELNEGFSKLDATVDVVEDGNAGLERARGDRPDLILLCIELPRMNGFSVCNKLKKNADLKSIPLVIMSSEATEETFEQHRKLRTRAEDYIRKPFDFDDLMEKVSKLIQIEPPSAGTDDEAEIAIEDEIAIDDLVSIDEALETDEPTGPVDIVDDGGGVDAEVEQFAEDAFNALMMGSEAPKSEEVDELDTGAGGASATEARERTATPPPREPPPAPPAPPAGAEVTGGPSAAEATALQEELEELREKVAQMDALRRGAAEAEGLRSEVEALKRKVSKGGGGREFLDLREQLNKKDKEILDLKDSVNSRDKQILDVRDRLTAVEREKADIEDKLDDTTRDLGEAKDRIVGLEADKETVGKRAQDLQGRLERAQAEAEKTYAELEEQKRRRDELAAEKETAIDELRTENAKALEALANEKDATQLAALEKQEGEVLSAKADALAGQKRQHDEELGRIAGEHETALQAEEERRTSELEEAEERRKTDLRLAEDAKREALEAAAGEAAEALAAREQELQAKGEADVQSATERHGREMAVLGGKLAEVEERLQAIGSELEGERKAHEATQAQLAEQEDGLEATRAQLGQTRAGLDEVTGKLAALREEHEALEERNSTNEERALRALQRVSEDGAVIEKAKKALAIGLALLDEQSEKHAED